MGIRTIIASALPSIFGDMGEEATYTPNGGSPISCHIFIKFGVMLQPGGMDSRVWQQGVTIAAMLSEILAQPSRGDKFTYDGTDYTVQEIIENDGLTVKVAVT